MISKTLTPMSWMIYRYAFGFLKPKQLLLLMIFFFQDYLCVLFIVQALKASKHIWFLSNADSQEDIAYPNDFKGQIEVDDEFKSLFRDIDIPSDLLDVEKELQKIGLKPVMNTAQRRAAAQIQGVSNKPKQKKKKQEISKRTKLTNAHLPELFQNLNASSSRN